MGSIAFVALPAAATPVLLRHARTGSHIPPGREGRWDYIAPDPANHRQSYRRQDRVMVVDEDTGSCSAESLASTARTVPRQ